MDESKTKYQAVSGFQFPSWYRVKIVDYQHHSKVECYLIDFGITEIGTRDRLAEFRASVVEARRRVHVSEKVHRLPDHPALPQQPVGARFPRKAEV